MVDQKSAPAVKICCIGAGSVGGERGIGEGSARTQGDDNYARRWGRAARARAPRARSARLSAPNCHRGWVGCPSRPDLGRPHARSTPPHTPGGRPHPKEKKGPRKKKRGGAPSPLKPHPQHSLSLPLFPLFTGPTMAMIAFKCPDIQVTVVDINQVRKREMRTERDGERERAPHGAHHTHTPRRALKKPAHTHTLMPLTLSPLFPAKQTGPHRRLELRRPAHL